jgi:AmiR/NasT family two-component response regulator
VTNLKRAVETREVIGVAIGILVARERCGPDEAFDMLRRASMRENKKLVELARAVVEGAASRAQPTGKNA